MVVNTRTISRDTADEVLDKAVQYAAVAGERDKTRMVCAILHKKHYDLGVVHTAQGIQAVFQVGEEWDNAVRLTLRFIRAKLPPDGQAQDLLCPRWKEKKQESEEKLCVTVGSAGTRSTRTRHITASDQGRSTLTRAGKAKVHSDTLNTLYTHTKLHTPHT